MPFRKTVKPIEVSSLQKKVYDTLRASILAGEFKPGEQLTISEIAKKLHVSTMPVREALRQLEAQGMITFFSQKKIKVTKLSREDLQEFYWIRIPLECRAFARNFDSINSNDIKQLEKLHQSMSKPNVSGHEWVRLNRKFHMIIYGAEKSPVLKGALAWLWNNVGPYLNIYAQTSAVQEANEMHKEIIDAIKNRNLSKGCKVLKEHLQTGLLVTPLLKE